MIKKVGLNPQMRLGALHESDIKKFEDILETPASKGLPAWMFNRQKDPQTGEDIHIIASDLELQEKDDIALMRETRSWKGVRHSMGLKVRGQRTKTTARKGRSIGVSRSRVQRQK
jgi:small subunit ribosomal protein S13